MWYFELCKKYLQNAPDSTSEHSLKNFFSGGVGMLMHTLYINDFTQVSPQCGCGTLKCA